MRGTALPACSTWTPRRATRRRIGRIVAALERAQPGDTIQFGAGTYVTGEIIVVSTARLTFLGHTGGTILRGCDPEVQSFGSPGAPSDFGPLNRCGMFELRGGHATLRGLTFEYMRLGLVLGCCETEGVMRPGEGGYLIEDNTFRNSFNSIRGSVSSHDPTVIRRNTFTGTFHAVSMAGSNIRVLDNEITMPERARVPGMGHPGFAIAIGSMSPTADDAPAPPAGHCDDNVIAGNRIEGHTDGILILSDPRTTCSRNVIRDNTIVVRRVGCRPPWLLAGIWPMANAADTTIVGVPVSLFGRRVDQAAGRVQGSRVENNQILGAEGVGIEIVRAAGNRIANNTITSIGERPSWPGNTIGTSPEWRDANGAGIWVSPGSTDNQIIGTRSTTSRRMPSSSKATATSSGFGTNRAVAAAAGPPKQGRQEVFEVGCGAAAPARSCAQR